jgi:hypothetical protein
MNTCEYTVFGNDIILKDMRDMDTRLAEGRRGKENTNLGIIKGFVLSSM